MPTEGPEGAGCLQESGGRAGDPRGCLALPTPSQHPPIPHLQENHQEAHGSLCYQEKTRGEPVSCL